MSRQVIVLVCLALPPLAAAQDVAPEKQVASVVALLEDDTDFLIENLKNPGANDASIAQRVEQGAFSGVAALSVSAFQRFNYSMKGWNYTIAEDPKPGEFRYLRFAWKRTEAPGIMLQLFVRPKVWHRYYAGKISKRTESFGAMTRVADEPPQGWELVTRDLFKDFGPMTITGLGLTALEGPGLAYYDHIYLGRTVEDLDRVTAALQAKNVEPAPALPEPATNGDNRWIFRAAAIGAVVAAILLCLVSWLLRSKSRKTRADAATSGRAAASGSQAPDLPSAGGPVGRMLSFSCSACGKPLKVKEAMAGKVVTCPACGQASAAPAS